MTSGDEAGKREVHPRGLTKKKNRWGTKRELRHLPPGPPVAGTRREPKRGRHRRVRAPSRRLGRSSAAQQGSSGSAATECGRTGPVIQEEGRSEGPG